MTGRPHDSVSGMAFLKETVPPFPSEIEAVSGIADDIITQNYAQ